MEKKYDCRTCKESDPDFGCEPCLTDGKKTLKHTLTFSEIASRPNIMSRNDWIERQLLLAGFDLNETIYSKVDYTKRSIEFSNKRLEPIKRIRHSKVPTLFADIYR